MIPAAISFNPTRPVFDPDKDSGFSEDFSTGLANPYLTVHTEKNIQETLNVFISSFGELKFTDWLRYRQKIWLWLQLLWNVIPIIIVGPVPESLLLMDMRRNPIDAYESITTESLFDFW